MATEEKTFKELFDQLHEMNQVEATLRHTIEEAQNNIANELVQDASISIEDKEKALDAFRKNDIDTVKKILPQEYQSKPIFTDLVSEYQYLEQAKQEQMNTKEFINNKIKAVCEDIAHAPQKIINATTSFFSKIINQFKDTMTKANAYLSKKNEQVKNGVKSVYEAYKNAGKEVLNMINEGAEKTRAGFKALGDAAHEKINEKATDVQKTVNQSAKSIKQASMRSASSAKSTLNQAKSASHSVLNTIGSNVKEQIQKGQSKSNINIFRGVDSYTKTEKELDVYMFNIKEAAKDLVNTIVTGQRGKSADYQPNVFVQKLEGLRDNSLTRAQQSAIQYKNTLEKNISKPTITGKQPTVKNLQKRIQKAKLAAQAADSLMKQPKSNVKQNTTPVK